MTAWTAIWAPGPGWLRWQLTIINEKGDIAMQEMSAALTLSPHPHDDLLVTMGLIPKGKWEPGEGGSFSCPVLATQDQEDKLNIGLLARGRSDPRGRPVDERTLMPRTNQATGG